MATRTALAVKRTSLARTVAGYGAEPVFAEELAHRKVEEARLGYERRETERLEVARVFCRGSETAPPHALRCTAAHPSPPPAFSTRTISSGR